MSKRVARWLIVLLWGALPAVCVRTLPAAETRLQFLHALQQNNYADMAIEYLDLLEAQTNLPASIRDVLDLERCNSYLALSKTAASPKLAEQRQNQAQNCLKKFLAEHPNTPRAATAVSYSGMIFLERGQQLVRSARRAEEKAQQESLREEARKTLDEASQRLEEALKLCRRWAALLADAPQGPAKAGEAAKREAERQEVEAATAETVFNAGLAHYYQAELYDDPKDPLRTKLLRRAAGCFDDVYQQLRSTNSDACLTAHLWHARVLEELGDLQTVQDILDEVLANAPDADTGKTEMAPLYAEAALLQLRRIAKQGQPDEFVKEAGKWLQSQKSWSRCAAYQGLVLEKAKVELERAKDASPAARQKVLAQLAVDLAGAARVESEYKEDAILLHRQVLKELGTGHVGIEESLALGDAAWAARQLTEAAAHYERAQQAATQSKDQKQAAEARIRLNRVRYAQALALYSGGKYEEALQAAGAIAREDVADPSSAHAALLALSSALSLYAGAPAQDKPAALARLEKIAGFVTQKWSGRPEADEAQVTLGQAHLLQKDVAGAMACFQQVTPGSRRYPSVLLMLGQVHWQEYRSEKDKKDETARNQERMNAARAKALECMQEAVRRLTNEIRPDAAESASQLLDAQLLLAEALLEVQEYRQVVSLLDPVIARTKGQRPKAIDKPTFRAMVTLVRAQMALGDTSRAAQTGLALVEMAEDQAGFNEVLVNFAKLLRQELRRAEAAVIEAKDNPQASQEAEAKRDSVKQLLVKFVEPLLKRKEYTVADMVYLGDLCAALNLHDKALQQYQQLLQRAESDPAFAHTAERAIVRVSAQLVSLLRDEGRFEEAVKQSDALIAKNPRALDPRLVKAYVLEDWAKQDASKYGAAVAQWTEVRVLLGRLQRKPPEYYTAIYRTASCLYEQWQATKDPLKLSQAEQVLRSTVLVDSKSVDAELLAQYKDLIKRVTAAREKVDKQRKIDQARKSN